MFQKKINIWWKWNHWVNEKNVEHSFILFFIDKSSAIQFAVYASIINIGKNLVLPVGIDRDLK